MRALLALLAIFPLPLWAADIPLESEVSAVTLYPYGATIVREVPFSMPSGEHQLLLTDLPDGTNLASVRVDVAGANMGSVAARRDFVPPSVFEDDPKVIAAREEVERLEAALRSARSDIEVIRLEIDAANARVSFLERLGEGEGATDLDLTTLRDLTSMIGEETLSALKIAHEAERHANQAERDLKDLIEELDDARQALKALVPEDEERSMLAVTVSSETAAEGLMTVTYNTNNASWLPVYDVALTRETEQLEITRGAFIQQNTGENWEDTTLVLSTVRPNEQAIPGDIWPWLLRIYPGADSRERGEVSLFGGALVEQDLAIARAAPILAEANFDGLSVTYTYPKTVSVATGADRVRITLGTIETDADITAQAVPLSDQTAFLMAGITNDSGEVLLPTNEASFYLDGRYVGTRNMPLIASSAEVDLSFGSIDGLRLKRVVLDRNEGDRGVISRSNEITEDVRIEVENLTGETWPIRLIDRVPYSEQEDLDITWSASTPPDEQNVDDKKGVLAWNFDVAAGSTESIELSHKITWPEDMQLQ